MGEQVVEDFDCLHRFGVYLEDVEARVLGITEWYVQPQTTTR
jgi:hypothetical protein